MKIAENFFVVKEKKRISTDWIDITVRNFR